VSGNLCVKMNGACIPEKDECRASRAMRIYNNSLTEITDKYCGNSCCRGPVCCAPSGQVFIVDIENALGFIFNNTVIYINNTNDSDNGRKLIDFNMTHARRYLERFLNVTLKYLKAPKHIQDHTRRFIETVYDEIKDNVTFTAENLQNTLINIQLNGESDETYLSKWQTSVSCHNINPTGCYADAWLASCGTWNMFHTMTVTAYNDPGSNPLEVIHAIKGFMAYFFSCPNCRTHFANMYNQTIGNNPMDKVDTTGRAVLWLWCIHNAVNQDWTGDTRPNRQWPPHPRFPLPGVCDGCWTGEPEVPTHCATLFCDPDDVDGFDKCFTAFGNPEREPTPIIYYNFSVSATIDYLNRTYFGPYRKLNTNQEWHPYIFDEELQCPNLRK
ncbi:unnamed protein product, partial [Meganyctiphanes norvegica]